MGCLGVIVLAVIIGAIALATSSDTPAPAPASSEKQTLAAAEQAYLSTIVDQSRTVGTALTELGELLQNYRFGSNEWTTKVAFQMVKIRMVYDEAMEMTPPQFNDRNTLQIYSRIEAFLYCDRFTYSRH